VLALRFISVCCLTFFVEQRRLLSSTSKVDSEFMTKLEESYTKAKDFIVDESLQEEIDKGRRERAAWAQKNTGAATL